MAVKTKLAAHDFGDTLQRPERSRKACGLGASDENLHQRLLLAVIQSRFATGPAGGAQGVFTACESLTIPAQHRLAADLGAPSNFGLGKTLFQQGHRSEAALLHRFEITSCCLAYEDSRHLQMCHSIMQ